MTSETDRSLPRHVLSVTIPIAKHDYDCAWHENQFGFPGTIKLGAKYVRVVWEDHDDKVHSDHICSDCWCSK